MKVLLSRYHRSFLALLMTLCLTVSLVPRADAEPLSSREDLIQLYYTGTFTISAAIKVLSSGDAECWGHVDCYPGYTTDAVMRLQWLDGTVWRNYYSWYGDGNAVDFYGTYPIPEGRTYRVRVIADVFDEDGNWVEMVDAVSGSKEY